MFSTIDMIINAVLSIMGGGVLGFSLAALLISGKDER